MVLFSIECDFCHSKWAPDVTKLLSPRAYTHAIEYRLAEGSRCDLVDADYAVGRRFRVLETGEVACASCMGRIEQAEKQGRASILQSLKDRVEACMPFRIEVPAQ